MKATQLLTAYKSYFDKFVKSFPEGFVLDDTEFPYATYSVADEENLEEGLIQVRVYTKSSSFKTLANIIDTIEKEIDENGRIILGEFGVSKLYKGSPFYQLISEEDKLIKSAYININYIKIQI